eukprot:TRINITY_DN64520_c0_g1_i1.p1 TRINITY_DN64520_c0_g1~~TRINITY_DN64520_c0_g1_i1.p1  ORF type:complete len:103 (-),score=8.16 TRINITY_DN64520_c0_g1_i1:102-410(-)
MMQRSRGPDVFYVSGLVMDSNVCMADTPRLCVHVDGSDLVLKRVFPFFEQALSLLVLLNLFRHRLRRGYVSMIPCVRSVYWCGSFPTSTCLEWLLAALVHGM